MLDAMDVGVTAQDLLPAGGGDSTPLFGAVEEVEDLSLKIAALGKDSQMLAIGEEFKHVLLSIC